jgi:hypothetical protein
VYVHDVVACADTALEPLAGAKQSKAKRKEKQHMDHQTDRASWQVGGDQITQPHCTINHLTRHHMHQLTA